ncbi:zinc-binding dehydrogenase [Streptomyces sp. NPDC021020]|uniref:zinc-binding dehydrogenase n=1 Tax=Streptomyces sp. NPDC021020 TaxID=3365109 RepID=UPI0037B19D42
MRAVQVRECGAPEVLRVVDVDDPRPAAGEVVVAVEAAGVIYGDVIVRSGGYPFPLPYVPGLEVGGRVVAVGPEGDTGLLGRRVVATTPGSQGGYAELARAAVADVHVLPEELELHKAVAVFQAGALAAGLLAAMRVEKGETVLVTAAAGRVGSLLVQLAKAAGATVVGAASGARKVRAAGEFGADRVVDYAQEGWAERAGATDVVLDAAGGELAAQAMGTLRKGSGRFGTYGFTSGSWVRLDAYELGMRGLTVVAAAGIAFARPAAEQYAAASRALAEAAAGRLTPRIHAVRPLSEAPAAHAELASRATVGATLLVP